jgi:GTPase
VLNKVDRVPDPSLVQVLQSHHPRAVAVSAARREGHDARQEAVIEMLSPDFANAAIDTNASNGKVLAYLVAHAEIYRQEYADGRVHVYCYLPRHLLHHIQGPNVKVRFLEGT